MKSMGKVPKHLPLLLLLSMLAAALIGFRSVFVPYLVEPIAALLWAAWRLILSVDQNTYWGLLILVCVIVTVRVFATGTSGSPSAESSRRHEPRALVERWQSALADKTFGQEHETELRSSLSNLLASMLGQTEEASAANLRATLASKRITLPPAAQRYLFADAVEEKLTGGARLLRLWQLLPAPIRGWIGNRVSPDRNQIRELIQWMEFYMELSHDQ